MPRLTPISQRRLIQNLREFGFEGPHSGGNHQFMVKDARRLFIPNPHEGDIDASLLAKILKQAGIEADEWLRL